MRYSMFGAATTVFVALLPFVVFPNLFYSAVNSKYFYTIAAVDILLLLAAYEVYRGNHPLRWRGRWLVLSLCLVLISQIASSYFGVFPEKSFWSDILRSTGILFLAHVAALSVLVAEFFKKDDWTLLRRGVAISAAVFSILVIIGAHGIGAEGKFLWINLSDDGLSVGNSTFAGAYVLLAFILCLIELARSSGEEKWRRIMLGLLGAMAVSPIMFNIGVFLGKTALADVFADPVALLGSARASSATMFLLLLLLAGRYAARRLMPERNVYRALSLWSGLLVIGAVAAVGMLFVPGSAIQKAYVESSTEARIIIWDAGFAAFKERPYFGWGPENFNDAYEKHFNNELYLDENIGEVWFDRAHNIIIDSLVTLGMVGVAALVLFALVFLWTVRRAYKGNALSGTEAVLLAAFIPAHFLQLQTGFDTVTSYVLVGVIVGYALWLEREIALVAAKGGGRYVRFVHTVAAALIAVVALTSIKFIFYDELARQKALVKTFTAPPDEQKELIRTSLSQSSDWESLRLSTGSFIKGAIASANNAKDKQAYVKNVLDTAAIYEKMYDAYFARHPDYYRARMNYGYLLLFEAALGKHESLLKAKDVIESSYGHSPDNPLTYGLDALVFLYGLNFDKARERAQAGIALNPEIEFSQDIQKYVEQQIRRFPRRNTLLQLENL